MTIPSCRNEDIDTDTFKIERERVVPSVDSVSITGSYSFAGTVKSMKVNIGERENLIDANIHELTLEGTNFSGTIESLKPSTKYYYCYAVDFGTSDALLTETKSFTTLDAVAEIPTVTTVEVLAIDSTTFRITCEVVDDGGLEVSERGICWNSYGNPYIDDEYLAHGSTGIGEYSCRLSELAPNTQYYVRAYAKNGSGIGYGEVLEFRTGSVASLPIVSTEDVYDVTVTSATCLGNVVSDGGLQLTERGVCWDDQHTPTLSDDHVSADEATVGVFRVSITGLETNKTYRVRCYATNSEGTAYGEELTFTTAEGLPTVITASVTDITATTAKGGGMVTDEGASAVTERGVCWSKNHNPTTDDSHVSGGMSLGAFNCVMTGLEPNETYYVRAYATNEAGTSYGAEVSFTALEGLPVVTTQEVTDITSSSAKGHGTVTEEGGSTVTERGVCWSIGHNPTVDDSHAHSGTGEGEFTVNITEIAPATTYYVRAYATNTQGTTYGEEQSFTSAPALPTVTTQSATDINTNSAKGHGTVDDDGGATVTERGICWSTNYNPTITGYHASSGTGTGAFTVNMTGLSVGTTYHMRAYAINSAGTSYGNDVTFTTTPELPTVTTRPVSNITQTTASCGGNVTSMGGAMVTERGVCWSTSHNPTVNDSHASSGTGGGSYTVQMTGLTVHTTYYVRAYATNSVGTAYGVEVSFTTLQQASTPTVLTNGVSNVTTTSATGTGSVTADGGAAVTTRGLCWGTNHNPTTSGAHASSGTGTGTFTINMTGLSPNTTYYVRAYATNNAGTAYGNELNFTTLESISGTTFSYDFNNSSLSGWTFIDADGDGYNWRLGSDLMGTGYGHNASIDCVLSQSYDNSYGPLYPNNYMVSEQVVFGSGATFSFWACAQDPSYPNEHFGVFVSTGSNTNTNDFVMVQEWTMTSKGESGTSSGHNRSGRPQGTWRQYTVDLSAYAGQTGYIAIRHFNCTDQYCIVVDDIQLSNNKSNR